MITDDLQAVDSRTRTEIQRQLMADESFLFCIITSDRYLTRWCTRLIATSQRLLTIRNFIFDTSIKGISLQKIETIRHTDARRRLTITGDVKEWQLEFESGADADEARERLEELLEEYST